MATHSKIFMLVFCNISPGNIRTIGQSTGLMLRFLRYIPHTVSEYVLRVNTKFWKQPEFVFYVRNSLVSLINAVQLLQISVW